MKISVVIPTFNRAHTLGRALDSVLAQTRPAAEIIVVDDGSDDATAELLQRSYPQVTTLRQTNRGVSHARNRGVAAARHDWIAFLDSDDSWQPDKLGAQTLALQGAQGSVLCHTDEIWIRRGRRVNPMHKHAKRGGDIFMHCLPRCAISPSTTILRKALLEEVGGFDETMQACEDYDLWLRVCSRYPVSYLPRQLAVRYGGHADQLSQQHWGMDRFRVRALEKLLADPGLRADYRMAALRTVLEKLDVLLGGAQKRNNTVFLHQCEARRAVHDAALSAMLVSTCVT
ncbi:MAG: glycosyltransferase family 2 protein [Gammaproteobacteria bacterium]|nr:glycosyltransferase family 2 protein [Gammaproteobacteria bacterium]